MADDTAVPDTLAGTVVASVENCDLQPRELMPVRIAALAAVDAPPASYLLNAGAATDAGITLGDVQDVLTANAPVVGSARIVGAAANLGKALGFVIATAEAEQEEES